MRRLPYVVLSLIAVLMVGGTYWLCVQRRYVDAMTMLGVAALSAWFELTVIGVLECEEDDAQLKAWNEQQEESDGCTP